MVGFQGDRDLPDSPRLTRRRYWLFAISGIACAALAVPWVARVWMESRAADVPRAACLLYHRLVDESEFASLPRDERLYSITPQQFETQIDALRRDGWQIASLHDVLGFAVRPVIVPDVASPEKRLLITFDDGCESIATLLQPILRRRGWRATLFITTDPLAEVFRNGLAAQPRMSDAQIRDLDPNLFDLGSHGRTHRPLNQLDDAELDAELLASRAALAALTGRAITSLAIPGNWYDARVLEHARRAGYQAVFTSDAGTIHAGDDLIGLPRLNVPGYFAPEQLVSRLSPSAIVQRRMIGKCRRALAPMFAEEWAEKTAYIIWQAGGWPETLVPLLAHIGIGAFELQRHRRRSESITVKL